MEDLKQTEIRLNRGGTNGEYSQILIIANPTSDATSDGHPRPLGAPGWCSSADRGHRGQIQPHLAKGDDISNMTRQHEFKNTVKVHVSPEHSCSKLVEEDHLQVSPWVAVSIWRACCIVQQSSPKTQEETTQSNP